MSYILYATMRKTKEDILIGEWNNLEYFKTLLTYFEESDNISRFFIVEVKNDKTRLCYLKELPEKGKSHVLTKKPCIK